MIKIKKRKNRARKEPRKNKETLHKILIKKRRRKKKFKQRFRKIL